MMGRRVRHWLWHRLVFLADRIAPELTFRCTGFSYTFERNQGFVCNSDGRGTPIWYSGPDHDRAWAEGIGAE